MKTIRSVLTIIVALLLMGCNNHTSVPIYHVGDRVVIGGKLHGQVVQTHEFWGTGNPKSEYSVVVDDMNVVVRYYEKELNRE